MPRSSKPRSSKPKSKKSPAKVRSYTVLRSAKFDPKKKLARQGKTVSTTKLGTSIAQRYALKRSDRPSRMYLFRDRKIRVYSIAYSTKDGKVKAKAKYLRAIPQKRTTKAKKSSSSKPGSSFALASSSATTRKKRCKCKKKGSCKKKTGKLYVMVGGRRVLITKSEKEKLKKKLGLRRPRRRSV
ncbi:unnamed protein product [Ectocarpus sp. 12 AP-2014]